MDTKELHCKSTKIVHLHHNRWMVTDQLAFHTIAHQMTTNPQFECIFGPMRIKNTCIDIHVRRSKFSVIYISPLSLQEPYNLAFHKNCQLFDLNRSEAYTSQNQLFLHDHRSPTKYYLILNHCKWKMR